MSAMRRYLLAAVVLVSACAPKLAPAPVVTTPKFPEFMQAAGAGGVRRQRGRARRIARLGVSAGR